MDLIANVQPTLISKWPKLVVMQMIAKMAMSPQENVQRNVPKPNMSKLTKNHVFNATLQKVHWSMLTKMVANVPPLIKTYLIKKLQLQIALAKAKHTMLKKLPTNKNVEKHATIVSPALPIPLPMDQQPADVLQKNQLKMAIKDVMFVPNQLYVMDQLNLHAKQPHKEKPVIKKNVKKNAKLKRVKQSYGLQTIANVQLEKVF